MFQVHTHTKSHILHTAHNQCMATIQQVCTSIPLFSTVSHTLPTDCQLDVAGLGLCETAISSTLKAFFKLLPDPLIPNSVASAILDINGIHTHSHTHTITHTDICSHRYMYIPTHTNTHTHTDTHTHTFTYIPTLVSPLYFCPSVNSVYYVACGKGKVTSLHAYVCTYTVHLAALL